MTNIDFVICENLCNVICDYGKCTFTVSKQGKAYISIFK